MCNNLDKYVAEFDEDAARAKLAGLSAQELTDHLIYEYKLKRVLAKMADEAGNKLQRINEIVHEPSKLAKTPGIPSVDDLRRMMGDE